MREKSHQGQTLSKSNQTVSTKFLQEGTILCGSGFCALGTRAWASLRGCSAYRSHCVRFSNIFCPSSFGSGSVVLKFLISPSQVVNYLYTNTQSVPKEFTVLRKFLVQICHLIYFRSQTMYSHF